MEFYIIFMCIYEIALNITQWQAYKVQHILLKKTLKYMHKNHSFQVMNSHRFLA